MIKDIFGKEIKVGDILVSLDSDDSGETYPFLQFAKITSIHVDKRNYFVVGATNVQRNFDDSINVIFDDKYMISSVNHKHCYPQILVIQRETVSEEYLKLLDGE